ncbi:MAG: DEAD/DEAH box helicase [Cytophagia bacterium]|nr:DEAD/DEAH box helicase [Cytophagia bacterium]
MKFDEYHIAEGIKRSIGNLGYKKPTDIQFKAIPHILNGEDVLAIAHTGTGKTAAFVIPVLHILQQEINKTRQLGVKCLVMAPTHELAQQIDTVFKTIGKHTRIKTLCILGGVDQDPQKESLEKGVDVVIATPGRLFDLVSQGSLVLSRIQILILDEADHMLDLGFIKDIRDLMKHLPKRRQTLFFSATINDKIKKLAYSLVNNAIRIQISPKDPVAKNIEHGVAFIEMDDKRFFLADVINNNADKKILVFVRTKVRAERVKAAMERVNIETETIHSDVIQEEREHTMANFRSGKLKVLIATDVSARGIDIPQVEYVINYDLPDTAEFYVHRVGRTGRGRAKGIAISFCSEEEKKVLAEIEENMGKAVSRIEMTNREYHLTLEMPAEKEDTNWKNLLDQDIPKTNSHKKKKKNKKRHMRS